MEKQIYKIITDDNISTKQSAKEIESHVMEFIVWYSGMEKEKIERAYKMWLRDEKILLTPDDIKK